MMPGDHTGVTDAERMRAGLGTALYAIQRGDKSWKLHRLKRTPLLFTDRNVARGHAKLGEDVIEVQLIRRHQYGTR